MRAQWPSRAAALHSSAFPKSAASSVVACRREKREKAKQAGRRTGSDSGDDADDVADRHRAAHEAAADPFFQPEAAPFSDPFFQVLEEQCLAAVPSPSSASCAG